VCAYLDNAVIMFMIHSANATVRYSMKEHACKRLVRLKPSAGNLGESVQQSVSDISTPRTSTCPTPRLGFPYSAESFRIGSDSDSESSCDEVSLPSSPRLNVKQSRRMTIIMDLTEARSSIMKQGLGNLG